MLPEGFTLITYTLRKVFDCIQFSIGSQNGPADYHRKWITLEMNGIQFLADIYLYGFSGSDKSFVNFSHEYALDVGPLALPIPTIRNKKSQFEKLSTNERLSK